MNIPENVNFILRELDKMGYKAYIVGGCVRDSIMGKIPKDWDIATSARAEQVKVLFAKTYDTGLKHGTVTVVLNEQRYEVTTFRIDGEYKDCRRPESVVFSDNIEDDLKRRDFTINAVAWNEKAGFVDPFGGLEDIKRGLVKGVGVPEERFREDALRMLRAVRFAACLGFEIESETAAAIVKNAGLIKNISVERISCELLELLAAPRLGIIFSEEFLALMGHISPELAEAISNNRGRLGRLLADCKRTGPLRFATFIFYMDARSAESLVKKLKFSNKMYDRIVSVHNVQNERIGIDYYDVVKKMGEWGLQTFEDYLYLQMLDCIANDADLDYIMGIEELYRQVTDNNYPVFISDLALNGYDLAKEFSISGKAIGKTLDGLLEYVRRNPEDNTYDSLLREAYSLITKS